MLKITSAFVLIFLSSILVANDFSTIYKTGSSWLSKSEELNLNYPMKYDKTIKREMFHEVSIQKINDAITLLKDDTFLKFPHDLATDYTSGHFKLEAGKRPYLVRAVSSGGGGKLWARWNSEDKILTIIHSRLGDISEAPLLPVPLVINLETAPKKVLVTVEGVS